MERATVAVHVFFNNKTRRLTGQEMAFMTVSTSGEYLGTLGLKIRKRYSAQDHI
jgi:hypothetical protein